MRAKTCGKIERVDLIRLDRGERERVQRPKDTLETIFFLTFSAALCPLFPPDLEDDGPAAAAAAAFPLGTTAAGGITGTPLPRRAAGGGMATAIGGGGGFCSISISLFTRTVPNNIGAGGAVPERPAAEEAAADTDAAATADAGRAGGAIGLGKSRWSLLEEALSTSSALLEAALSSFKFVTAAAAAAGSATWWLQPATGSQSA